MIKWYGTVEQFERLHEAVHNNCLCEYDVMDNLVRQCASHNMIDSDQSALDHLLFIYINRERLIQEENCDTASD